MQRRLRSNHGLLVIGQESGEGLALIHGFAPEVRELDTLFLVRGDKVFTLSSAAIRALLYMKLRWRLLYPIFWLVPYPIRDLVYSKVAKWRKR